MPPALKAARGAAGRLGSVQIPLELSPRARSPGPAERRGASPTYSARGTSTCSTSFDQDGDPMSGHAHQSASSPPPGGTPCTTSGPAAAALPRVEKAAAGGQCTFSSS